MRHAVLFVIALSLVGCDPQAPTGIDAGPSGDNAGGGAPTGGDDGDDTPEDPIVGHYVFAVSASATDPTVQSGSVSAGALDLYLWLVETNLGLSAIDFDIRRDGASLPDEFFTPAGLNLFLTWEGSGQVVLAVAGCPTGPALLGTIHLEVGNEPILVQIVPVSEQAGAVDCRPAPSLHEFSCTPFVGE